jgi:hypothetical protein
MPINLRIDLRFRRDKSLAERLDATCALLGRIEPSEIKPKWWQLSHANRMKRSFIRHRSIYRYKARLHYAFNEMGLGHLEIVGLVIALVGALFIRPKRKPGNSEAMDRYDAYLLRCEIEDLMDETRSRIARREAKTTT